MPAWSLDGSQMAVISDDYQYLENAYHWEVFTVSRGGQGIHWLDVEVGSDAKPFPTLGENLAWSPDGRYIAFFGNSLYILDTEMRRVFDLCIPYATQTEKLIYPENTITWSPDSTQILFQRGDAPALVIDLESNRAAPLVEDFNIRPIGWLRVER